MKEPEVYVEFPGIPSIPEDEDQIILVSRHKMNVAMITSEKIGEHKAMLRTNWLWFFFGVLAGLLFMKI